MLCHFYEYLATAMTKIFPPRRIGSGGLRITILFTMRNALPR